MLSEEKTKPSQRYLYTDSYWSDKTIKSWQQECRSRLADKEKDDYYNRFMNWKKSKNEIAVFTMYAYADFSIPKHFDCIFHYDNPEIFQKIDYQLTQSIWEGWMPVGFIDHGHKHLVVLQFADEVPEVFKSLYLEEEMYSTIPAKHFELGLCQFSDLDEIIKRHKKINSLKERYGKEWREFDDGE